MMKRRAESLVDVTPGETVRVRQVLFDTLRAYCGDLGVHEGDQVTLIEDGVFNLLLEEADGRLVHCPCEFARFVEVAREKRLRERSRRVETRRTRAEDPQSDRSHGRERSFR
jgi:hypothetical protein